MNLIGTQTPGGEPLPNLDDERFAAALVRHGGNATEAYLEAFPETTAKRPNVWSLACRLRGRPDIRMRYNQLRAAALAAVGIDLASLVQDTYDIAEADANEIIRAFSGCCRHCHGIGHAWQWRDVNEYVAECDKIEADNTTRREQAPQGVRTRDKPLPIYPEDVGGGGFGFDPHAKPNVACPQCMGVGLRHVVLADTTDLSPQARKLYKGVKIKGDGSLEVLMHDQMQARDMLHRMAGVYKDAPPLPGGSADGGVPDDVAIEDAGDVYMQLVHGGAPA
jgi:phage terminase small subunit